MLNLRRILNVQSAKLVRESYYLQYSNKPVTVNKKEEYEKQLKDFEKLANITKRTRTKKPQRAPFLKNVVVGEFDTEVLTYPQLEKPDLESLQQNAANVEALFKQSQVAQSDCLDKFMRQNLADYRLLGLQVSQFLNGFEYNVSESCKFFEIIAEHKLRDNIISNELLGIQTLNKCADEALKAKYLGRLMSGELLSAICVVEQTAVDVNSLKTTAVLDAEKKNWIVNGEKTWVLNGSQADVFIIFALSNKQNTQRLAQPQLTAFLVEKDFGGVSATAIDANTDDLCTVTFNNVKVPKENIIGTLHKGEDVLKSIITEFRLSYGPICSTMSKNMLNKLVHHFLDQPNAQFDSDAVAEKVSKLSIRLFALDSMTYLTSGLLDSYENQDCELEAAIVKLYASETAFEASRICLDMIGSSSNLADHWAMKSHMEILRYLNMYENNDNLLMVSALLGLQHAGVVWNEKIKVLRNPLFHAWQSFVHMWTDRRNTRDEPRLDLNLKYDLHPSCVPSANKLEYAVKRLAYATEVLFLKNGNEVVLKHMQLRRLAACIIDVYAMAACISRASRSYCIGLQNCEMEMLMANTFCFEAMERVRHHVRDIVADPINNDENYRVISKKLFKFKEYFIKHPLDRNF